MGNNKDCVNKLINRYNIDIIKYFDNIYIYL